MPWWGLGEKPPTVMEREIHYSLCRQTLSSGWGSWFAGHGLYPHIHKLFATPSWVSLLAPPAVPVRAWTINIYVNIKTEKKARLLVLVMLP